jgi:catechol 2,3-dioxygenase-like lactoylglutathione lyase family enzyme
MSEVIDHVGIRVSDLATSRRMYEAALAELGFAVLGEGEFEGDAYVLFGRGTSDDFALHAVGTEPGRDRITTGAHIAFRAPDAVSVERWHAAAIDNGGTDNGPPGLRPRVQRPLPRRVRARPGRQQRRSCLPHTCAGRRD